MEWSSIIEGVNDLLEQVQKRDAELWKAYDELKRCVEERTKRLEQEITERVRAEEGLRHLNEDLEKTVRELSAQLADANRALDEMSACSLPGGLNGSLRAIDVYCQALMEDCAHRLDGQCRGYLERLRGASQRLSESLNHIRNLSPRTEAEVNG